MYISLSRKLAKTVNGLPIFNCKTYYYNTILILNWKKVKGVVTWKAKGEISRNIAQKFNLPLIQLEDAFIGYLETTAGKMQGIGLYYDDTGNAYYKNNGKDIISQTLLHQNYTKQELQEASHLIKKITENGITKFNTLNRPKFIPTQGVAPVIIIDQVLNDNSITSNKHGGKEFKKMYEDALLLAKEKYGTEKVYVKTHPNGSGYLMQILKKDKVTLLTENYNVYDIFPHVNEVFTVSSQTGFEALLANKTVHTYGTPFYAGYGLTIDNAPINRPQRTLAEVFYASYLKACRYFIAGVECELSEIIDVILEQKRLSTIDGKINRIFFYQIPLWKMPHVINFVFKKNLKYARVNKVKELEKHHPTKEDAIVIWGFKGECSTLMNYTENNNIPILTFEDGFIRSIGLGSDFITPHSLIMDRYGIYYNPQQTSELEIMLQNITITDEQRSRAKKLQQNLIESRITKYNIGTKSSIENIIKVSEGRKVILITCQVSDDMSIIKGGIMVSDYRILTKKIRAENPEAFIIYKHHPDVIASNRRGYISSHILKKYVDAILTDEHIIDAINVADEVHTITSLSGFEALLRGKTVVHYGLPFYGGYGFTEDKSHAEHTREKIDFEAFLYTVFFLYPRYTSVGIGIALTPEIVIKIFEKNHNNTPKRKSFILRKVSQILRLAIFHFK